ncbi:MAG: hypothetical protein OEY37_10740 [Gammaproteobacteria bacterium]|nr:hypothetical protein [Gammaproteobacteria bacterium]MDH5619493.1 hypothetical protein [Gammaproteobacteria bacterium]
MRHVIVVVGSEAQRRQALPRIRLLNDEAVRESMWLACRDQDAPGALLDDTKSVVLRILALPFLAYRFYLLVHNTRLWAGKRPLVLIRGRGLASRMAAYAGSWGGGDIVKADAGAEPALGPTRYVLQPDGSLKLLDV